MAVDTDSMLAQLRKVGTTPVLTWVDADGRPASSRVVVGDVAGGGVVLAQPAGVRISPGPANLMAHSHNERLWDLKSVCFPGQLTDPDGVLLFVAARQVGAVSGPVQQLHMLRDCGRAAQRYLDRRGLDRPKVSYRQVAELKGRAKALGID
jgi:hypothetical protein